MSDYSFVEVVKARERMCKKSGGCANCELKILSGYICGLDILKNPEQAQEIIMKWAKEHPVKTNADKFKEVFGTPVDYISFSDRIGFWQQEYKERME